MVGIEFVLTRSSKIDLNSVCNYLIKQRDFNGDECLAAMFFSMKEYKSRLIGKGREYEEQEIVDKSVCPGPSAERIFFSYK